MYTLLVRIEAILNSRPLTALSNEVNDFNALAPEHFLIGHPITAPIEPVYTGIPTNRLSRWQLIEACRQKPFQMAPALFKDPYGTLVVVKEDNVPPLQWRLGRVVNVHPGTDNLVRVVSVKCKSGVFKRAITKICPLPIENEQ
ncbi:hypothetical protein Zmor_021385 [Zophobas morio]|uniref:DUF5641 domain-containing protein n=1 Tax=Zophobas morio TaxID=2755281 RepID=A0AA38MAN5_9CUCU|nr:hypothetical protein Zmor_021385 [Zophobas morio]